MTKAHSFGFLTRLWTNWITVLGAVITTLSACAILFVIGFEFAGVKQNAYANSFMLLALPGLFASGLSLTSSAHGGRDRSRTTVRRGVELRPDRLCLG